MILKHNTYGCSSSDNDSKWGGKPFGRLFWLDNNLFLLTEFIEWCKLTLDEGKWSNTCVIELAQWEGGATDVITTCEAIDTDDDDDEEVEEDVHDEEVDDRLGTVSIFVAEELQVSEVKKSLFTSIIVVVAFPDLPVLEIIVLGSIKRPPANDILKHTK